MLHNPNNIKKDAHHTVKTELSPLHLTLASVPSLLIHYEESPSLSWIISQHRLFPLHLSLLRNRNWVSCTRKRSCRHSVWTRPSSLYTWLSRTANESVYIKCLLSSCTTWKIINRKFEELLLLWCCEVVSYFGSGVAVTLWWFVTATRLWWVLARRIVVVGFSHETGNVDLFSVYLGFKITVVELVFAGEETRVLIFFCWNIIYMSFLCRTIPESKISHLLPFSRSINI